MPRVRPPYKLPPLANWLLCKLMRNVKRLPRKPPLHVRPPPRKPLQHDRLLPRKLPLQERLPLDLRLHQRLPLNPTLQ